MSSEFIQILFVDDALTEIESICQTLRDSGFLLHANVSVRPMEIRRLLETRPPDLILFSLDAPKPTLSHIIEMVRDSQCDAAVLALNHQPEPAPRRAALRDGARDLVSYREPDLLTLIVRRELSDLQARRLARGNAGRANEAEQRCRILLDSARDAIAYIHEGAHIYVNEAYLKLFGYHRADELTAMPLLNLIAAEDRDRTKESMRRFVSGDDANQSLDVSGIAAGGRLLPLTVELTKATLESEPCTQLLIRDCSAEQTFNERIAEIRRQDPLTGLVNRPHFQELLDELHLACSEGLATAALLYVSLDNHRTVCDTYGHESGDDLVLDLGRMLQNLTGPRDTVSRLTGADFALMVHVPSREHAKQKGGELLAAIEARQFQFEGEQFSTSARIGITMLGENLTDATEIIRAAHRACNESRLARRSRVAVSKTSSELSGTGSRQDLATAIDRHAREGRVMLSYQAIVSLPGGAAERYETRVWIKDETDRPCAPLDVFPAAEPLGLSPILDCWAVARIADALGSALEQGRKLSIFMPVSTNSILDSMFEQAVKKHLPYGHGLVLQIDEDVAERYFRQMRRFAQRMRDHGCALAISEFGGQQNSERLMRHLKPEYIKLRPDLLERMRVDDYTRKYIDAVSEEIRTLGGEAVASRVSSAQQLATLRQSRFNLIQGDLVHTPAKSMSFDFANAAQWVGANQDIA